MFCITKDLENSLQNNTDMKKTTFKIHFYRLTCQDKEVGGLGGQEAPIDRHVAFTRHLDRN